MTTFSIIIPVLDEIYYINPCIEKLTNVFERYDYEIIVVDGDKTGRTIKEITHTNIKKYISFPGRAKQMNFGADIATGQNLIFLHADSELPGSAPKEIVQTLNKFKAGAFDIKFKSTSVIYKILSYTVSWRARLNRIPYGDQTIFIRKNYFQQLGGFAEIPIMEDAELMLRIKRHGEPIRLISDRVITSARRWESEGVLFTMIRNPILSFLFYRGVSAEKLAAFYKSGKLVYKTDGK